MSPEKAEQAVKSQAVPWQGRDRAPSPSSSAAPRIVPSRGSDPHPQTLNPSHSTGESICTHADQTGESPKPNTAESIQPNE